MSTTEDIEAQIVRDRAQRRKSEREVLRSQELVDDALSLWARIRLRRQQNGFGEDFEIALTRRS